MELNPIADFESQTPEKVAQNVELTEEKENSSIGFFEKYLSLWVLLCMIVG